MVRSRISTKPLKIALVSPYDLMTPGGVNDHVSNLATQLRRKGHYVTIVAPASGVSSYKEGTHLTGRAIPFPSGGSVARITLSLSVFSSIRRLLDEQQFDVIHLHEPMVPLLPLVTLGFSKSVNIATFHAFQGTRLNRFWSLFTRGLFNKLDCHIAVSAPAREFVSKYYPAEYEIIPNGVDLDRFSGENSLNKFKDGKVNILFLGRMEKRKGFKYLLSAYLRTKKQFPDIRLIVAGGTQPLKELRPMLKSDTNLDIEWVGQISDSDVPKYYHSADIFCAPNTGNESFGIVLLEAMASGKPIIASRIDGFLEVMENDKEGVFCDPENEEELEGALKKLIKDAKLRASMGKSGRLTAKKYSWDIISDEIEDTYFKAISKKHSKVGK